MRSARRFSAALRGSEQGTYEPGIGRTGILVSLAIEAV
jgi:hypothetical protein